MIDDVETRRRDLHQQAAPLESLDEAEQFAEERMRDLQQMIDAAYDAAVSFERRTLRGHPSLPADVLAS